jgi:hypothetical protein
LQLSVAEQQRLSAGTVIADTNARVYAAGAHVSLATLTAQDTVFLRCKVDVDDGLSNGPVVLVNTTGYKNITARPPAALRLGDNVTFKDVFSLMDVGMSGAQAAVYAGPPPLSVLDMLAGGAVPSDDYDTAPAGLFISLEDQEFLTLSQARATAYGLTLDSSGP